MALRQTKKISELPPLSPASLDTTFVVGISGSTTYKISINQLTSSLDTTFATDLVTATLSGSLDGKLSTSSFNSYTASISTASLVTSISNLNTFTASQSTSSLVNRLTAIESVSGSWITESETGSFLTSLSGAISSSTQISDLGFVTGSYTTINSFNSLTQSFNSISQSFNVISGSVGTVDFNGVVSSSAQITAFGFISSSQTIDSGSLVTTSSFNSYTASISTASLVTSISNLNTFTASVTTASIVTSITNLNTFTASVSTASLVTSISNLNSATSSYLTSLSGAISSSSQLTSSYDTRYVISGSVGATPSGTISGSAQITAFGFISSSTTIDTGSLVTTSSFNSYTASLNAFSSSLSVTANSSTKILDAYYTSAAAWSGSYSGNGGTVKVEANFALYSTSIGTKTFTLFRNGVAVDSGSFYFNNTGVHATMPTLYYIGTNETGTNTYSVGHNAVSDGGDSCNIVVTETFNTLNAGLISGSSQLTSSFDTRYVISGLDTMQISNSLAVTGSTTLKGTVNVGTGSGLEGGEIDLALAQSGNTTLTGSAVVFDVYGDKVRIFEGGGNSRGVSIDLSKAPNGVGGDLMWKASGLVNRGVDVTLGNLKARIAATGNVALQLSTVSGTYSVYGSSVYSLSGVAGTTIDGAAPKAISTTPAYLNLGYNFGTAGATDTWNIMDTSNSIAWRITMILGAGVNNNLVSIERLH